MINVQQITSTLAQLPDAALQQYAEMHKSDPYKLALAVSESTRRKSMRQAAQAQQAGQAPGTVAEEALAGMGVPANAPAGLGEAADAVLPPEQGFADGGGVSQFVQDIRALPERYQQWWEENRRKDAERAAADAASAARQEAVDSARSKASFSNYLFGTPEREAEGRAELAQLLGGAAPANPNYGNEHRREVPFWGPPAAPTQPAAGLAAAADKVLPKAEPTGGARVSAVTSSRSTAPAGGPPQLNLDTDAMYRAGVDRNAAVTDAARKASEQDLADLEAQQAARGKLGAGREERLRQQEAGLGAKQEQAKRDALLQAGFAILSADPSKGAWSAIGTGALQGLQGYKGDMADLAKQREALLDKLDELDTLRRQEAIADGKDRAAIRARIRQVEVDGAKLNAELGNKLDLDVKPQAALAVFKEQAANWRSQQENATRLTAARIGASAGSRNSQDEIIRNIQASRPGMTYEQAYQVFAGSKRSGFDMKEAYADYLKTPAAALNPMSYQQFSAQFGPPQPLTTPGQGVPIRP